MVINKSTTYCRIYSYIFWNFRGIFFIVVVNTSLYVKYFINSAVGEPKFGLLVYNYLQKVCYQAVLPAEVVWPVSTCNWQQPYDQLWLIATVLLYLVDVLISIHNLLYKVISAC